jgi:ubiquinone/menaquinone biosynthesis C-methylase UbiE
MDYVGASPNTKILEVGCGSGFLSRLMAQSLDGACVLGMDTDPDMLDVATQLIERDGLSERIQLSSGDTYRLPFADESFDLVTSHRVL